MRNWEILDEARETLIDRVYLIYLHLIDAVGRTRTIGDSFHLENIYEEPMDTDALRKVLREFETICSESPKYHAWNDFPAEARSGNKLFWWKRLKRTEWYLLRDFLAHEEIPYLSIKLSPKQQMRLWKNLTHRISVKISHLL